MAVCKFCLNSSICNCGCNHHSRHGTNNICSHCCSHRKCIKCKKCFDQARQFELTAKELEDLNLCACDRCRNCGNVNPGCDCCDESYATLTNRRTLAVRIPRYCTHCCTHRCCNQPVEHVNRPFVFWVPTANVAKEPMPYEAFTLLQSESILDGSFGSGKLNLRKFKNIEVRRFGSVEIEVSSARQGKFVNDACKKWSCPVVYDGSINNHGPGGFEINTAPALGDAFEAMLRDICDALKRADSKVNATCGLHTHVDTRDFGYHEIRRLARAYVPIEPALFAATTPDRATSRFCVPCAQFFQDQIVNGIKADTSSVKSAIIQTTYGDRALDTERQLGGGGGNPLFYQYRAAHRGAGDGTARYWAYNLHTWFRQGTVECRLHHGTIDFDEIYWWYRVNLDFVDAVYRTSSSELDEILTDVEDDPNRKELCDIVGQTPKTRNSKLAKAIYGLVVLSRLIHDEDVIHLAQFIRAQRKVSKLPE